LYTQVAFFAPYLVPRTSPFVTVVYLICSQETRGKIKELLDEGAVAELAAVLVSAVYFKVSAWWGWLRLLFTNVSPASHCCELPW
jgi:hypothetical protein